MHASFLADLNDSRDDSVDRNEHSSTIRACVHLQLTHYIQLATVVLRHTQRAEVF
jgi:hypothetical protein